MKKSLVIITLVFLFFGFSCTPTQKSKEGISILNLSDLKLIGQVDEKYQSFNVEMCEVVGGEFWIPYDLLDPSKVATGDFNALKRTIPAVNLYDEKLRMLTNALEPLYIRVSGTWANTTYFQDDDEPQLTTAPEGYENVLTRKQWKGVIDFCEATNSKLVTSFAVSNGMRDSEGNWTPAQIEPLVNYTKLIGGEIAAAEMFNEPTFAALGGGPAGYDAAWFNRDFASFKSFVESAIPEMKIVGPGSVGEGGLLIDTSEVNVAAGAIGKTITTEAMYTTEPIPEFEIFSYHFYGGVSKRCGGDLTPEDERTSEWFSKTEKEFEFYKKLRDKYNPDAPIWLTETAEAACGGNPWAATYNDCFRYLEQLGRLAKKGVQVVMHNTLCASEYALLDQDTHEPRPNYWAAFLWSKLMGTEVYDAGITAEGIDVFIHNLKGEKGYTALIVNPKDVETSIEIPADAEQYLLTADELLTKTVKLNGEVLELTPDETLPDVSGKKIKKGETLVPPHSIQFLAFKK
ncbi:hypothetical protein GM418_21645 [Maribellus comscasis]|uniref:Uncharacterized protein n=1 Tax=Maribellus comscasis TaxID=2681766 RepID=A0A6I6K806_9BACT|nr:hypothetical protein [Maribellus comscasis]QGY46174.1 hypothetical protein GM418_21645 [Maribellus comscasis]